MFHAAEVVVDQLVTRLSGQQINWSLPIQPDSWAQQPFGSGSAVAKHDFSLAERAGEAPGIAALLRGKRPWLRQTALQRAFGHAEHLGDDMLLDTGSRAQENSHHLRWEALFDQTVDLKSILCLWRFFPVEQPERI